MAASNPPDPEREYRLIEQLELRIASAESSEKLESIIQKFLPALIVKLASDNVRNRNLAIKVCQYVNQRLKIDESIQLPIEALTKTFGQSQNAFVKQFCLLFIQQGFARLPQSEGTKTLPGVLRSSLKTTDFDRSDQKMSAIAFGFLYDVLKHWKVPQHGSPEADALKDAFALSIAQTDIVAKEMTRFVLYDPKTSTSPDLTEETKTVYEKQYVARGSIVPNIARLLFTSLFTDSQRFIPAVVLSVDANSEAASTADIMFKQCNFDLETDSAVDALFQLYDTGRPKLQTRVLSLLSRSQKSTEHSSRILNIIEKQLSANTTGLEGAKLRTAVFNYLSWAVRISHDFGSVAAGVQTSLKEYIELQGWPVAQDTSIAEADLRSKAYESIGLVAASKNYNQASVAQSAFDLIAWLFTSLRCDTTKNTRHSIEEALSRVMNAVHISDPDELQRLRDLLLWNMLSEEGEEDPIYYLRTKVNPKYPAVRFANKCFPFSDINARFINLIALNSERREIAEEGHRGLDPYWHASNARITGETFMGTPMLPSFTDFANRAFGTRLSAREASEMKQTAALSGAVTFARNLIASSAWADSEYAVDADQDWKRFIEALLENNHGARAAFRSRFNQSDQLATTLLLMAGLKGLAQGSAECASISLQLVGLASDSTLRRLGGEASELCDVAARKSSVQYHACRISGIITSLSESWATTVASELSLCTSWSDAIGQEVIIIRAHMLKAIFTMSRASLRGLSQMSGNNIEVIWKIVLNILESGIDKSLRETAFEAVAQLGICLPPQATVDVDYFHIFDLLMKEAKKESESAVAAIGSLISFMYASLDESQKEQVVSRLFELNEVRKAEFHFALGRAMTVASLGFKSSATMIDFDVDGQFPTWGFHQELFESILDRALEDSKTTKPSLKKAVGIWMLSLVEFCNDADLLKSRLRNCQAAFSRLLTNRDEVVQETGSRGLGVVYEKGDKSLRDDLVRDLVQSFTGSGAKMSGTVDENTQLFEPGALPTEQGQSVTTYKDIVSLAQEMGDPSLVYRFMNLASNNAIWTSRAAFGRFGLSNVLADSSYLSENKKFYPKLFRYRFDPNPNVQRSMDDIWKALVKDSNATIDENFDLIMDDLLKSIMLGKEWRAREASCAAISDLVQGRDIEKLEKYLDEIWTVAFKVLDDIKESVRVAAMKLCRTLTAMLTRNLETGQGDTKRATTMLNHTMPFLLQQMEGGSAKEVQQYAIITLLDLIKKAPARSLQRFTPTILEKLINSLSSLEHESINYLHLNADKYGLTAEKLDKMRVSSISASPVTEAIERCLESLAPAQSTDSQNTQGDENAALKDAMLRLEGTFRTTIGLPSKVGLSRVLVTLVVRHQTMFRPYADRFVRLTRKSVLDRNATISVSFSMALAYLMRLASDEEIRQTSQYAQRLYFENQDASHRTVAGEIIQAIGKTSSDVFMNYATIFLPFAFIGRQDTEADTRNRFDEAWKDNVGGSRALNLYLKEIVELLSLHIKSSLWPIRHACCFAVADLASSIEVEYSDADARMLWPLMEEALTGKTWDGKEKVISAFPKFVKKASTLWPDHTEQIKKIALREAKRTNAGYRPHAISALGDLALARRDLDLAGEILPVLTHVFDELLDADAMDVDDKHDSALNSRLLDTTLSSGVKCLFASLRPQAGAEVLEPAMDLIKRAHSQQSGGISLAVYEGAQQNLEQNAHEKAVNSAENKAEVSAHTQIAATPAYERFWQAFVAVCLAADPGRHAEATENIRRVRVDVARTLAQSGIPNLETRGILAGVFDMWLSDERSRPLRLTIEQAAQHNSSLLGSAGRSR